MVAYLSRPRDLSRENVDCGGWPILKSKERRPRRGILRVKWKEGDAGAFTPPVVGGRGDTETKAEPAWGRIKHAGWSGPESGDLHGSQLLQFEAVVGELGGLVEAKAVSIAPMVDVSSGDDEAMGREEEDTTEGQNEAVTVPDPLVVNLLRRPGSMGLRDYFAHLTTLGMIDPPELGTEFLIMYERARFSGAATSEEDFRDLMGLFADILKGMKPVREDILEGLHETAMAELNQELVDEEDHNDDLDQAWAEEASDELKADAASLISNQTVNHTPQPNTYATPPSSSAASVSSSASRSSGQTPAREGQRSSRPRTHRYASARSTTSAANPPLKKIHSATSTTSIPSLAKSDAGSVIRLAEAQGPLDLPYTFAAPEETAPR